MPEAAFYLVGAVLILVGSPLRSELGSARRGASPQAVWGALAGTILELVASFMMVAMGGAGWWWAS